MHEFNKEQQVSSQQLGASILEHSRTGRDEQHDRQGSSVSMECQVSEIEVEQLETSNLRQTLEETNPILGSYCFEVNR